MAQTEASVTLDTQEWDGFLSALVKNLKRAQDALMVASEAYAFQDIIEHFRLEKGPDGAWPRRAPATDFRYLMIQIGQWKAPQGMRKGSFSPTNKLLQLTGHLRMSFLQNRDIRKHGRDAVAIYANAKYAARHNFGRGVPKREFMWLSDTAQQKVVEAVAQIVMEDSGA